MVEMNCSHNNIPGHENLPAFVIAMVTSFGSVILTCCSIVCIAANKAIDPSLRGVLLSFSMANFVGTCILTYETISDTYLTGVFRIKLVITVSIALTLSHLMFLLLAERIIITSKTKRSLQDFRGLIIVAWIISVSLGSVLSSSCPTKDIRITFATVFIFIVLVILILFSWVTRRYRMQKRVRLSYERKFLDLHHHRSFSVQRYWRFRFFVIIFISYIICALPFIIKMLVNAVRNRTSDYANNSDISDLITLIIYTLNFYSPSIICIYLWFKKRGNIALPKI